MKSQQFFNQLKTQGKINSAEWDTFVGTVPEFEIPDTAIKAFEDNFLTRERALADSMIHGQIRALSLNPIDNDIKKLIQIIEPLDKDLAGAISKLSRDPQGQVPDTFKQMEQFTKSLPSIFEKLKTSSGDEDFKKKLKEKDLTIQELTDKFTSVKNEYENKEKALQGDFENKMTEYKLDSELAKLANSYTLAEAYAKNKDSLHKMILQELKSSNKLQLGDKEGQTMIQILDEHGKPRFNGNSPVTINSVLDEKFAPFLKQNGTTTTQQTTQRTIPDTTTSKIRQGVRTTVS